MKTMVFGLVILFGSAITAPARADVAFSYIHADALGSPIAATDGDGSVVWREHYQPFGKKILSEPSNHEPTGYTGHRYDSETALMYMGARYYDPELARFMGMDSVGVLVGDLNNFNRYAYANNNPYRFVDPDGRDSIAVHAFNRMQVHGRVPRGTAANPAEVRSGPSVAMRVLQAVAPGSLGEAALEAVTNAVCAECAVAKVAKVAAVVGVGLKGGGEPFTVFLGQLRYAQDRVYKARVDHYRAMIRSGKELPPVAVVPTPDGRYVLMDGNHRATASRLERRESIQAEELKGRSAGGYDWSDKPPTIID